MMAYDRWFAEGADPDREKYPVRGIDVSHHNGEIDFDRLSAKESDVSFIYIKATEGTDFQDPGFIRNYRGAMKSGIPAGAYHFFRYDTDGELQALNFIRALRGRPFTLPPAIDVEDWGNPDGHATALIVERLRLMTACLLREGYRPVIYTNLDGYHRIIRGNFDSYPLWMYPSSPARGYRTGEYALGHLAVFPSRRPAGHLLSDGPECAESGQPAPLSRWEERNFRGLTFESEFRTIAVLAVCLHNII